MPMVGIGCLAAHLSLSVGHCCNRQNAVIVCAKSVYFLVSLVSAHLADGIFQHCVLLIEVVDRLFTLGIVVHGTLEEKASGNR